MRGHARDRRALAALGAEQGDLFHTVPWDALRAQGEHIYNLALLAPVHASVIDLGEADTVSALQLLNAYPESTDQLYRALLGVYPVDASTWHEQYAALPLLPVGGDQWRAWYDEAWEASIPGRRRAAAYLIATLTPEEVLHIVGASPVKMPAADVKRLLQLQKQLSTVEGLEDLPLPQRRRRIDQLLRTGDTALWLIAGLVVLWVLMRGRR